MLLALVKQHRNEGTRNDGLRTLGLICLNNQKRLAAALCLYHLGEIKGIFPIVNDALTPLFNRTVWRGLGLPGWG